MASIALAIAISSWVIRKKLNKINPRLDSGHRKSKHHQHTTEDHGLPELKDHLIKVMTLMDAAANDTQFNRLLNRSLPKFDETYEMKFEEEKFEEEVCIYLRQTDFY